MIDMSTFDGSRVLLRPIENKDGPRLGSILSDLQEMNQPTVYNQNSSYFGSKRMLEQILKSDVERCVHFGIRVKKMDGIIGVISFQHWSRVQSKATLGYVLDRSYWNQGIATEALSILLKFGFRELGLQQVEGRCQEDNIASQKVMTNNGFTWVRTAPRRIGIQIPDRAVNVFSLSSQAYTSGQGAEDAL